MSERGRPRRRTGAVRLEEETGRGERGDGRGGGGRDDHSSAGGRTSPGRAGRRVTGGDPDRSLAATAASVLRAIPGFAKLLYRLMKDPRVSGLDRALFGFTMAYLFVPLDVIPDWIPALGGLDDLVLLGLALDRLLYRTDSGILLEHWDGDPYPLVKIRELLDRVAGALPAWARWVVRSG